MARFEVGFPIAYRSGGDTTAQAIGKHINEIDKIYGHLNLLDSESMSSAEINKIINSAVGSISLNNIKGTLDGSKISGTVSNASVPASNVHGTLSSATLPASNVSGLNSVITTIVNQTANGVGITDVKLGAGQADGYIEFGDRLIIQFGEIIDEADGRNSTHKFSKDFPRYCAGVNLTAYATVDNGSYAVVNLIGYTGEWFAIRSKIFDNGNSNKVVVKYTAFGW